MTARPWAPRPKAGDIVQCRFPEAKFATPGPKDRPALVIEVEEESDDQSAAIVRVAYGTSQHVEQRYPGELTVRATDSKAGLDRDTKFDLGNSVRSRSIPNGSRLRRRGASVITRSAARSTSKTRRSRERFRPPSSKRRRLAACDEFTGDQALLRQSGAKLTRRGEVAAGVSVLGQCWPSRPDQRFLRSSISRLMRSISWRLASGVPHFGFSAC